MKNRNRLFLRAFSMLAVFAIVILALTLSHNEAPPLSDVQPEPMTINLAMPNSIPAETSPPPVTTAISPVTTTTASATTTEPPVTTTVPPFTTPIITMTAPPIITTTAVTTTTLPNTTTAPTITTPPPMPVGAQWKENGEYFKMEGEQKYVWHSVVGWCKTGGIGTVTIMDVQSDGYKFYIEPDGRVNLGKVVTPNGDVISYEEYKIIRDSR